MHGNTKYQNCWIVFKFVFTLSHGQASVERGFSVNKELLVENLQCQSLVSQRMVYDHVISTEKSITELPIDKELVKSCKLAHSRYITALNDRKNEVVEGENNRKRKLKMSEIADVKEKKRVLEACIKSMETDIESYSIAAEEKNDLSLLTKANSFRVTIRSKKEVLSGLEMALVQLSEEVKTIKS